MSDTTTRLGLPMPTLGDVCDIQTTVQPLALALDGLVAPVLWGPASSRPAAGGGPRFFFGVDDRRLWFDDGSAWFLIDARGTAGGALTGTYPSPDLADSIITAAKVHPSLKPSAISGAAPGTEALRALGTGSGQAAPGIHATQHALGGADPLPAPTWTAVTFQSSWANSNPSDLSNGDRRCAYAKDLLGFVHLRGRMFGATNTGNPAFTLPAGLRPARKEGFPVYLSTSPGPEVIGRLDIFNDGRVLISGNAASETASISGISFYADA